MMTFDDVLPTLARVCEAAPNFADLERCAVVRDLRGRVRLVVDRGARGTQVELGALAASLGVELEKWFVAPILTTGDAQERGTLARHVFENAKLWTPSWRDPATGDKVTSRSTGWRRLERRLSKDEWLEGTSVDHRPPWPLRDNTPGIVTFYSFKGGVGRTTALVSCAWQLAREGQRVVVIDLDLEAPGLGALLDCETDRGVLDFVVDHLATGQDQITGLHGPANALGPEKDRVTVLPAGRLGLEFIEKLGRLDFVGSDPWKTASKSPVEVALERLLSGVRRELEPDYILIDSRAGVHDLAGLSLHRLAHVDVLVGRANEQGYQGLELTMTALAKRKGPAEMRTVLLHTMAPADPTSIEGKLETQEFRDRAWDIYSRRVYGAATASMDRDTPDAHHIPFAVGFNLALTRFSSLQGIEPALFEPGYQALRQRIETLCAPEDDGASSS